MLRASTLIESYIRAVIMEQPVVSRLFRYQMGRGGVRYTMCQSAYYSPTQSMLLYASALSIPPLTGSKCHASNLASGWRHCLLQRFIFAGLYYSQLFDSLKHRQMLVYCLLQSPRPISTLSHCRNALGNNIES